MYILDSLDKILIIFQISVLVALGFFRLYLQRYVLRFLAPLSITTSTILESDTTDRHQDYQNYELKTPKK